MTGHSLLLQNAGLSFGDFSLSLNLTVQSGETLVLTGPSGSGKTTALNLIAGFIKQESGHILIDGEDAGALPPWKRDISIVFQDLALFPHLSVAGNVQYGLFIRGVKKAERRRAVSEALAAARLSGFEKRRTGGLSGGEKQRVAIARALAASPRLLLMDEPFSSLDTPLRRAVQEEFLEIRSRSTVPCIFVTHDREEAALLGDRIALMKDGCIVECGAPRDLFLNPRTSFCADFFGTGCCLPANMLGMGGGRVFVPYDALHIDDTYDTICETAPAGSLLCRLCGSRFLNGRLRLDLELGGFRLSVMTGLRQALPPIGSRLLLTIDSALVRPLETEPPPKVVLQL
jgi:ABC-type Fe3+/spermidine/putrescine transport system ATPase subunit